MINVHRPNHARNPIQQSRPLAGSRGDIEHSRIYGPACSEKVTVQMLVGDLKSALTRNESLACEGRSVHRFESLGTS